MDSHAVKKLHIGAGLNYLPGWLNTEIRTKDKRMAYLDARCPFPFSDNLFTYVATEHQIEHFAYEEGRAMLQECFRVLRPNGRIRIATPDLQVLVSLYGDSQGVFQRDYIRWMTEMFMPQIARQGLFRASYAINILFYGSDHRFIYDEQTLTDSLRQAGFVDVVRYLSGESMDTELQNIEGHGKVIGREDINRYETLVLEARKPEYEKQATDPLDGK